MPYIAYSSNMLVYNPDTLTGDEKSGFITREVSDTVFILLKDLPSKAFESGTNVQDLVERLIEKEMVEKAA